MYSHVALLPNGGKALCFIDERTPPGRAWALGHDSLAHLAKVNDKRIFVRTELDIFHPSVSELEVEFCPDCVCKLVPD